MNIKSFFNGTVLKKDLTRFLPLWVIYLILGLLILMTTMGEMYFSVAETAAASLGWLSVVTMIYALITAQMLFGELFQSKLCNAIHALPVRREGLFLTHFAAGLIMHLGPNLAIALVGMLGLGRLWFVALLWWLALTLQYLIFFGMAVFCMHCAGNRFAGVALYVLVNFVSLVVMVFFELIYLPMLYGIEMTDTLRSIFYLFSPVVNLAGGGPWLVIEHSSHCPVLHYTSYDMVHTCSYYFKEFGDIWGYAIIAAVVGIGFAVAAFFIYRKRHMESAGDFVSFKPMGTVFTLMASATLGLALHAIVPTAGMIVGALVGFFVCRMLLERTIKVFNKKSWLYLIGLCLFIGLTLVLTAWDVGGVASRIPDAEDVESVTIADHRLSDWRLDFTTLYDGSRGHIEPYTKHPEHIHRLLLLRLRSYASFGISKVCNQWPS
jgi:ABC-2 type transport system permease protein